MNNPTKDDVHAYALSKTLTKVSSPATVGLYSPCQNRINMILRQMEVYMDEESAKIEDQHRAKPRSVKPSLAGLLALIGRLLFHRPVWTERNQQHHNIRFIYVHFSAWHFAGSDLLWAGIVIRLMQAMQMNFGKLQLALYRVGQHDEEEEIKKKEVGNGTYHWRPKRICCCPLWVLVLVLLTIPIILLVCLLMFGLPKPVVKPDEQENKTNGHVGMIEGLLIASLGVPAASALRFIFLMVKNLIFNQDNNMKKGMDKDQVSSRLGFMNEVRKEMWFLTRFIQFMELFERRRIRVVLKITNLDRCPPKKIVAVLEAINILLSDEESPFISILAVNPDVLVQKVNFADGCLSKEDRAYALLNRIVTLAFTLPPLCDESKNSLYHSLTGNSKFHNNTSTGKDKRKTENAKKTSPLSDAKVIIALEESNPMTNKTAAALDINEEEVEKLVGSTLTHSERKINKYMSDDVMSMRRVITSIRVTVIIMMALEKQLPEPDCIAAWVVLATRWPCRLSWIIQCAEDAEQRGDIERRSADGSADDSRTLWDVFRESKAELYVMSEQIEDLLEQDGDPEMFEQFLDVDFRFTVTDLKTFEVVSVNLDHTIRKELAQIRGTSRLKDSGWMRDLAPLHITTLINMDTEGVCKELERMNFPSNYREKVKSNNLTGLALLFGNTDDLKELLGMTFGEWATFRLHFLGFPSHLRSQYKNLSLPSAHPQNQLLRFKTHMANHYSSNSSLVSNST